MEPFNLSAEVSLQLAKGTAGKLKKEIQEKLSAELTIDDSAIAKSKKKAEKAIEVPVKFKAAVNAYDSIKKGLKPVPIEVKFSPKSVQNNLSSKSLKNLIGKRKITVSVGVKFSGAAAKQIAALRAQIAALKAAAASATPPTGSVFMPTSGNDILDLIAKMKLLANESRKVGAGMTGRSVTFFEEMSDDLDRLLKELGNADEIAKRFDGLDDSAVRNLKTNLNSVYKELQKLENIQRNLNDNASKFGINPASLSAQNAEIDRARASVYALLRTFDAGNPATFSSKIALMTSNVSTSTNQMVRDARRDFSDYDKLLSNLQQKAIGVQVSGGSKESLDAVLDTIKRVQQLRSTNTSFADLRADTSLQFNKAFLDALKFVDITTSRINNNFRTMVRRAAEPDFANSIGARSLDVQRRIGLIRSKAAREINKERRNTGNVNRVENITNIRNQAIEESTAILKRAENLNKDFLKVMSTVDTLRTGGFTRATDYGERLARVLVKLYQRGRSLEDISLFSSRGFANIAAIQKIEGEIISTTKAVDRLERSLKFDGADDFTNTRAELAKLRADVASFASSGSTDKLALQNMVTSKSFDIRQMDKINSVINKTVDKMDILVDSQPTTHDAMRMQEYSDRFVAHARRIISSGTTITEQFRRIQDASKRTFHDVKMGETFFDSIIKAGTLAAKRLGAFLIFAQGLYKIQNLIETSISESLEIDTSFIKLEQVLNKTFAGEELQKNLGAITKQVLSLGTNFGIVTTEVAKATQILTQAGIVGKDLAIILDTVAKSELGPSFGSASETAEATIAIMNQFGLSANEVTDALGGISAISAKYAVEAQGITEAVKRAGGVFSSAGGDISQFAAAFTVVKEQTREADESIATGLRNVAQRLQTSKIRKYLQDTLGVDIVNKGTFIGFNEAMTEIGKALKGQPKGSILISNVLQQIAGIRQAGRILPLIEDFERLTELSEEFRKSANSIDDDAVVALGSLQNKLNRAKGAFNELITEIMRSPFVKVLVDGFTSITTVVTKLLSSLNSLPGLILATVGAFKLMPLASEAWTKTIAGFTSHVPTLGRNKGGKIPGRGPNKDTVYAHLTKGEYVLNRDAVDMYGTDMLDMMNARKYNKGGIVGLNAGGGVDELLRILNNYGIEIPPAVLKSAVKSFDPNAEIKKEQSGFYNTKTKAIKLKPNLKNFRRAAIHETGHAIGEKAISKDMITKQLKIDIGKGLKEKMAKYPSLYGEAGSDVFNQKFIKEMKAVIFERLAARGRGDKNAVVDLSPRSIKALDRIEAEMARLGIKFGKMDIEGMVGPYTPPTKPPVGNLPPMYSVASNLPPAKPPKPSVLNTPVSQLGPVRALTGGAKSIGGFISAIKNSQYGMVKLAAVLAALGFAAEEAGVNLTEFGAAAATGALQATGNASATRLATGAIMSIVGGAALKKFGKKIPGVGGIIEKISPTKLSKMDTIRAAAPKTAVTQVAKSSSAQNLLALKGTIPPDDFKNAAKLAAEAKKQSFLSSGGIMNRDKDIRKITLARNPASSSFMGPKPKSIDAKTLLSRGMTKEDLKLYGKNVAASKKERFLAAGGKLTGNLVKPQSLGPVLGKLSTTGAFLTKNMNWLALAVGGATAGITYFSDSAKSSADQQMASASNIKDAVSAQRKSRMSGLIYGAVGRIGGSLSGALTGASAGSVIGGPVGAGIGAIIGAASEFTDIFAAGFKKLNGLMPPFIQEISSDISKTFGGLKEGIVALGAQLKEGAEQAFDGLYTWWVGQEEALRERQNLERGVRVNQATKKAKSGSGYQLSNQAVGDALTELKTAQALIGRGKGKNTKEKFGSLNENLQADIQNNLGGIVELFKSLNTDEQQVLLDAAQKSGVDMAALFDAIGQSAEINNAKQKIAFNKLSMMIAEFDSVVSRDTAKLTGIDAGIDFYANRDKQSFVPDQVFDLMKSGFNPKELGLAPFGDSMDRLIKQVNIFDKQLGEIANTEIIGRIAARKTAESVRGFEVRSDGDPAESLSNFLAEAFNVNSGGNKELNDRFNLFLDQEIGQLESITEGMSAGAVDVTKINDLFKQFADSLDSGAIEQIKRINEINQKFAGEYGRLLEERYAKEDEALSFIKDNVNKQKTLFEISNQARGLTGDKLATEKTRQASALDTKTLGLTLSGTGLGGGASVQQMSAAFTASKQRELNAAQIAKGLGGAPTDQLAKETEIVAQERQVQAKLQEGLKYIAGGTNMAADAMERFQQAAQKAAESSKFLTDSLLGNDEQMMNNVRGIIAYNRIQKETDPRKAQALLANMSSDMKAGLQSYISGNQEREGLVSSRLGFGANISGSPEAKQAEGFTQEAMAANQALATAIQSSIGPITQQIEQTKQFYTDQFNNMQNVIKAADQTAQNITKQLAALPEVITHEGKFEVQLIGAGTLEKLNDGIKELVTANVNAALQKYTDNLVKNNAGLNRP